MPIANIFSSYWSCIHGISERQRNDFLNLNEMRTEHRTENPIINKFRTHTRKLVASYREMKDLEPNLAGVNVANLPVQGGQSKLKLI